jgi:hypothetical protein
MLILSVQPQLPRPRFLDFQVTVALENSQVPDSHVEHVLALHLDTEHPEFVYFLRKALRNASGRTQEIGGSVVVQKVR